MASHIDMAWHAEARRLRREEHLPYHEIGRRLGKGHTRVGQVCADIVDERVDDTWRQEARRLRMEGMYYSEIADRLGKKEGAVGRACRGLPPPDRVRVWTRDVVSRRAETCRRTHAARPNPEHDEIRRLYRNNMPVPRIVEMFGKSKSQIHRIVSDAGMGRGPRPSTDWHEKARRLRREEQLTCAAIALRLGKSRQQVERVVRDIPLPRALRTLQAPSRVRPRITCESRSDLRALKAKPFVQRHNPALAHKPTRRERLKTRIAQLVTSDIRNRTPAPITLPRISLQSLAMEDA